VRSKPEIEEFDPEWLVVRGNYMTLITPDVAASLLERNVNNRKMKVRAIRNYARDMQSGKWNADAADLKFNRRGELIDGQNRLQACVDAGVPFPTLLRTGLDDAARQHVDQGVRRTVADSFRMAGVPDPNVVGAAVQLRARYDLMLANSYSFGTKEVRVSLTHQEALDYLAAHSSVEKWTTRAVQMARLGPGITRSVWVAFLSLCAEASEEAAGEFADLWIEGASKGTGDPLLALARYVALAKAPMTMKHRDRMQNEKNLHALVKVWNAWRLDERLDRLEVRTGEVPVPCV
jgi:hypothetical protein